MIARERETHERREHGVFLFQVKSRTVLAFRWLDEEMNVFGF